MGNIEMVKFLFGLIVAILVIIGLNSNMYSYGRKKFYVNYLLVMWCITCMITFIMIYTLQLYSDYKSGELDLTNAVTLYHCISLVGATVSYVSQLVYCKAYCEYYNTSRLFEIMTYFKAETAVYHKEVFLIITKIFIFPTVIEMTLILKQLQHYDESKSLIWTLYTLYPLIVANIAPNTLFSGMFICKRAALALNRDLVKIKNEANFLQKAEQILLHKQFYRMQRYCCLADNLDELSEKYTVICEQTLSYTELVAPPLLASLLCNLFGITTGLFRQYYALADTFINDESYDFFSALTSAVFLLISFLEIAMLSYVIGQSIDALKQTGLDLQDIELDNVDERFRQSVEKFSLEILTIKFKIQPMGFLNINIGILHSVLSAVTSFLLILIQSDLTKRFSLK